jgi:membrane associated rhomboid family serine protease
MFIPYGTTCYSDTPPYGTRLILLLNVIVYTLVSRGVLDSELLAMNWESPSLFTMVSSTFLQVGFLHLASNLVYLWLLGRIVEGAIGTVPFLVLCTCIMLGANSLEAAVLHGQVGGSLGASGLVFGLLTAAFLVSPRAQIHCFYMFFYHARRVAIPLMLFAAIMILLELVDGLMDKFEVSSATLHMAGAGSGALFAFAGLKLGLIDAGGWDWFSLRDREEPEPFGLTLGAAAAIASQTRSQAESKTCSSCGKRRKAEAACCPYCGKN